MRDMRQASNARLLVAPAAGAGLALGLLGLSESFYVAGLSLSAQLYGFGLYAVVGLAFGLGWGLLFGGKARRRDFGIIQLAGQAVAWPSFGLAFALAGFLVWRDMWGESLNGAGVVGWLVMLAVPIVAALYSFLTRELNRVAIVARPMGFAFVIVGLALPGLLFGRAIGSEGVDSPRVTDEAQTDERPPVVVIVADALRADALGAYGAGPEASPHLDAFAREAVVFDEAWSSSTWTRPAVASLMTGLDVSVHKTMHKSDRLPSSLPTLAGLMRGRGYTTVAAVTNVNLAPAFGLGRGFDAWGYLPPQPHLGAPGTARRLFLVEVYRLLKLRFFPGHRDVGSYYAEGERVSKLARKLMEPLAQAKKPFLAYLHYMEPHDPFFSHPYDGTAVARVENPNPAMDQAPSMLDLYHQEVRHWDGLLGEHLAWMKKSGLYDRALIIVTSDHGEEFGDHGHFWHGTSLYQELIRVPLLIRFPNGAGGGTRRGETVSLVDVMPTVLRVVGIPPPAGLSGRALAAVLVSPTLAPAEPEPAADPSKGTKVDGTEAASTSVVTLAPALVPERVVFAELDHQGCVLRAVRKGVYKLVLANRDNPRGSAEVELYRLDRDPKERSNLAETNAPLVKSLRSLFMADPNMAAAEPVVPEQVDVDAATEEQLRALGYTQ